MISAPKPDRDGLTLYGEQPLLSMMLPFPPKNTPPTPHNNSFPVLLPIIKPRLKPILQQVEILLSQQFLQVFGLLFCPLVADRDLDDDSGFGAGAKELVDVGGEHGGVIGGVEWIGCENDLGV